MNKITLFKSLFVALVLSVFSSTLLAEEVISNTFTAETMQKSVQTYTDTWENVSGTTLELFAFNNNQKGWEYVKCGRKADASVAIITTKSALAEKVTKVVVTIDNILLADKVNSTYLEVATDAAFTQNVQRTDVTIAKGNLTYTVANPTENCYYRLTYDCASHGSKNGIVQISKVDFYYELATEPEPEPEKVVTATWSIEEGDTLESFSAVTVTFAGVDSIGRKLDGVEVNKAYMMISTTATFFSVDAEGKVTPVKADLAEDYDGVLSGTNAGLSTTMKVREDRFTLVDGAYNKKGNYRIVIPAGTVLMQPNRTGLDKVYNDTEFVLNFVIDNDYVVPGEEEKPVEKEEFYTTNPAEGSKVAEIRNVVVTFEDVTALTLADLGTTPNPSVWPFCNKVLEAEDFGTQSSPIAPMTCAVEGNALTLSVVANDYTNNLDYITEFGDYTITIPAGVVFFSETEMNAAITLNYKIGEILPDTVRFANIAAIYKKGLWEAERYDTYEFPVVILESQPTVVDKVVTSAMMGGNFNNYYLNDGTGVIVMQAEGDMYNPITDENWDVIGWDTIPGLTIEVGKKLPAEFFATIDFKALFDDETWAPTGEVYGAPVLAYMPKVLGVEVDEDGYEEQITETNEAFAARCEASDFVEAVVFADLEDVLANRIKYAGQLLKVDTTANYYAETMIDHMTGGKKTTAYFYWDAETAFDVESYEEEGVTYVFVSPKTTVDYNNYVGQVFNVIGENLPTAAFDAEATMTVSKVRFDWNSVAMGQSIILKGAWEVEEPTVDVDNNFALVNVYSNNGAIYVEAEAGAMIEVYTVNGIRVFAGVSNTETTVINGLNNIAIIRVNGVAYKTLVK